MHCYSNHELALRIRDKFGSNLDPLLEAATRRLERNPSARPAIGEAYDLFHDPNPPAPCHNAPMQTQGPQ